MEEVAAEAGLSIATLYSVFAGGKAEVVSSIHRERLALLVGFAEGASQADEDAASRLRFAVRQSVEFFMAHPDYLRMHLREGHAWCMPEAVSARTRAGAEAWSDGVGAMIAIIEQGVRDGAFHTDSPARAGKAVVMLQQLHLGEWIDARQEENFGVLFNRYWRDVERLLGIEEGTG